MNTVITGVGVMLPPHRLSNQLLGSLVKGVDAEWTARTLNIFERRISMMSVVKMACRAGAEAIYSANLEPNEIDFVIVASTSQERRSPAIAPEVAQMLGISYGHVPAFDISAACAGFVYGLNIADAMIRSGQYHTGLVIAADKYSAYTDWTQRDCVYFGDGAGAAVIESTELVNYGILGRVSGNDGRGCDAWSIEDGKWRMDGKCVFDLAVDGICSATWGALGDASHRTPGDIDIIIPHQPGIRVIQEAARRLDIPLAKFHCVMDKYANTSSASVPIALHDALVRNKIKDQDIVLLVTVGAGWVWSATLLKWMDLRVR